MRQSQWQWSEWTQLVTLPSDKVHLNVERSVLPGIVTMIEREQKCGTLTSEIF